MNVIVLCGGNGKRMNEYSFPKPLNMIYGKPSLYYTLSNLPREVETVHFIVAPHLVAYNFAEIVTNLFPKRRCVFHNLPYFTRGAAESAYIGARDIVCNGPVVFLDNDNLYQFPEGFMDLSGSAFLGYSEDFSGTEAYSFMNLDGVGNVTEYKEKVRISNKYCCGVYGFASLAQFRDVARAVLDVGGDREIYLSSLYQHLLNNKQVVRGIQFPPGIHLGTYKELMNAGAALRPWARRSMRVCFDLDNTLVTYPVVHGDYSTVRPIPAMIELARSLKAAGHTIIIHTARRMGTHHGNTAAVIADIGAVTFKTLADFEIPYDELLFGKPLADMYIDDRAVNPYRNDMKCMGLLDYEPPVYPVNKLANNTWNTTVVEGGHVKKTGPSKFLEGELYFYTHIPTEKQIASFFPRFIRSASHGDQTSIYMEQIYGIPFYTLYQNKLITLAHLKTLFEGVEMLHATSGAAPPSRDLILNNYTSKLSARFACSDDYPFTDADIVQSECLRGLQTYYDAFPIFVTASYIHGDLWFSNILVEFRGGLKWIDMKGRVDNVLTTGGDVYYDYGKLYQSFLGFDAALYGHTICSEYSDWARAEFETWATRQGIVLAHLKAVTFSLVMGTFHSIRSEARDRVWSWIKRTFLEPTQ